MLAPLLLLAAAVPSTVLAFADTAPFVAWASTPSYNLVGLGEQGPVVDASAAYATLDRSAWCAYGGLLVIDVQGLHASDLSTIEGMSDLQKDATVSVDYLVSPSAQDLDDALLSLAKMCRNVVHSSSEEPTFVKPQESRGVHIVKTNVASEAESDDSEGRKHQDLAQRISSFRAAYPNSHVVLLTGHPSPPSASSTLSPPLAIQARAAFAAESPLLAPAPSSSHFPTPSNGTKHEDLPLLARYQILSTPILTCLIVSLGLLLPILMLGINALNSIRVPERMTQTKGIIVTEGKKNQ